MARNKYSIIHALKKTTQANSLTDVSFFGYKSTHLFQFSLSLMKSVVLLTKRRMKTLVTLHLSKLFIG